MKRVSGTIPYTAPEVCQAGRADGFAVDTGVDVWAFGVLIFCVLTGNFPWEAASGADAFFEEFVRWQRGRLPGNDMFLCRISIYEGFLKITISQFFKLVK